MPRSGGDGRMNCRWEEEAAMGESVPLCGGTRPPQ